MPDILDVRLPRAPGAPSEARVALVRFCAGRIDGGLVADAELLVTELVNRALRQGHIRLVASLNGGRLLVEVVDEGSGLEHELDDLGLPSEPGLDIMAGLSSRWGVREGQTHVWFELEPSGSVTGSAIMRASPARPRRRQL